MKPPANAGPADAIKRVAIHEAGHVVAAWFSRTGLRVEFAAVTASSRKDGIGIGGVTLVPWEPAASRLERKKVWDYLVTWIAGTAAELLCLGDADPAESPRSDLARSCELAGLLARKDQIRELKRLHGRIGRKASSKLIDQERLEKDANDLVILALKEATAALQKHRKIFRSVHLALMHNGFLNRGDLAALLGPRTRPARRRRLIN